MRTRFHVFSNTLFTSTELVRSIQVSPGQTVKWVRTSMIKLKDLLQFYLSASFNLNLMTSHGQTEYVQYYMCHHMSI